MKKRTPFLGAVSVEFALVLTLFLLIVFGLIETGRALYKWNAATEATAWGARTAAIAACNDRPAVLQAMKALMPDIDDSNVVLEYSTDGTSFGSACAHGTTLFVRVGLSYTYKPWFIVLPSGLSILPESIAMPAMSTTLPVEALGFV